MVADKIQHGINRNIRRIHHHAKHFFVPHRGNNHHPHALRPPALRMYAVSIIAIKLFVTAFLFSIYPSTGQFATITTSEILSLTNASRAQGGVAALSLNPTLNQAAQLKAQDMLADNYFAHTAPDGTKPWAFLKQAGYNYSSAGENLAMDFTEASTVHAAFMNSPSHKKNIMNEKYTEMGIAVMEGQLNGRETIILVEFFGTPYQAPAPAPEPEPTPAPAPEPEPTPAPAPEPEPTPAPAPEPEPTPQPTQAEIAANPLNYQAMLSDQSARDLGIKTLEKINFWVDFQNTGTATWTNDGPYYVAINVTNPSGRHSLFEHETWVDYYRPAVLQQSEVKPGDTGRFEFTLQAPADAGNYEESFGLVAENLTWIDGGSIDLPIVVVAPPEKSTETQVEIISTPLTTTPTEQPLATEEGNGPVVEAQTINNEKEGFATTIIEYSHRFYALLLGFLILVLFINIFVDIKVQHPHVIAQTFVVILIAATAIFLNPHFLEQLPKAFRII